MSGRSLQTGRLRPAARTPVGKMPSHTYTSERVSLQVPHQIYYSHHSFFIPRTSYPHCRLPDIIHPALSTAQLHVGFFPSFASNNIPALSKPPSSLLRANSPGVGAPHQPRTSFHRPLSLIFVQRRAIVPPQPPSSLYELRKGRGHGLRHVCHHQHR